MSHRLQVFVPEALDRRIRKAARRSRLPAGAWVRPAIERALQEHHQGDALDQLGAPTGDIDQLLAEIDAGRG